MIPFLLLEDHCVEIITPTYKNFPVQDTIPPSSCVFWFASVQKSSIIGFLRTWEKFLIIIQLTINYIICSTSKSSIFTVWIWINLKLSINFLQHSFSSHHLQDFCALVAIKDIKISRHYSVIKDKIAVKERCFLVDSVKETLSGNNI